MAQYKHKFVFTFIKDEKGEENKYRFMLTLSKKLSEKIAHEETVGLRLTRLLQNTGGVDVAQPVSNYSFEVVIARTFDANEVIAELTEKLETDVLSEIVRPRLVTG